MKNKEEFKMTTSDKNFKALLPEYYQEILENDPEFAEIFTSFAYGQVADHDELDDETRFISILATLIGCQGTDEFALILSAAADFGLEPVKIREIVYQAVAYLGIGRVLPFLKIMNETFREKGISLPLESQKKISGDRRREEGTKAQVEIFGESMEDFWKSGPEESRHINLWLASNCFGDYYTRGGLDLKERELITFCFLSAQGGCEPQLISHAAANMRMGNDKAFLIKIISQCLPYIGYPRSLNALRCVNEAAK